VAQRFTAAVTDFVSLRSSAPEVQLWTERRGCSVNVYYCTTWFTTDDVLFTEKASPMY